MVGNAFTIESTVLLLLTDSLMTFVRFAVSLQRKFFLKTRMMTAKTTHGSSKTFPTATLSEQAQHDDIFQQQPHR